MQGRAIHISSVDRQKIGQNKAEDFLIKFDPVLKLQNDMTHEIALDKVTMTYSWHNISDQYQNNQIKYSPDGGTSWESYLHRWNVYLLRPDSLFTLVHEKEGP